MNTIKSLSYKTLPAQTEDLIEIIREIVSIHNTEHSSTFVYDELTNSDNRGVWAVTNGLTAFPVVDGSFNATMYDSLLTVEAGTPEEKLFYDVLTAVDCHPVQFAAKAPLRALREV